MTKRTSDFYSELKKSTYATDKHGTRHVPDATGYHKKSTTPATQKTTAQERRSAAKNGKLFSQMFGQRQRKQQWSTRNDIEARVKRRELAEKRAADNERREQRRAQRRKSTEVNNDNDKPS